MQVCMWKAVKVNGKTGGCIINVTIAFSTEFRITLYVLFYMHPINNIYNMLFAPKKWYYALISVLKQKCRGVWDARRLFSNQIILVSMSRKYCRDLPWITFWRYLPIYFDKFYNVLCRLKRCAHTNSKNALSISKTHSSRGISVTLSQPTLKSIQEIRTISPISFLSFPWNWFLHLYIIIHFYIFETDALAIDSGRSVFQKKIQVNPINTAI